jgi:hypothetical protein
MTLMQRQGEERREFQRLRLDPAVPATFGGIPVSVVEIGVLGARIRHDGPLNMTGGDLRFRVEDGDILLRSEVVRLIPAENATGVRFLAAVGDSGDKLRTMLGSLVTRELENRRHPQPETIAPTTTVDGDKTVRGQDASYVAYRLENGNWQRRRVFLPEQPSSGFTVAKGEDVAEMQRLCRVYQASDEEGRRLIRLFAELSISEALGIPPTAPQ